MNKVITNKHQTEVPYKQAMDSIIAIEANDINNENGNMSSCTPAGQMMKFASLAAKDYTMQYLLDPLHAQLHEDGDIHIHDLDYYPAKTTTCVQYDLASLFENGFTTKNGSVRAPQSIQSYATLATIIFQTNQNEQHGGQSIPAFDFFLAPGILKTFRKHVQSELSVLAALNGATVDEVALKKICKTSIDSIALTTKKIVSLFHDFKPFVNIELEQLPTILNIAYQRTESDTAQAMEGFIHNLNTMHSRGGNQVVFSSINYGTDTSPEGRMVTKHILQATANGLGKGEIPVFPIQIFKVKDGVSYSDADYAHTISDFSGAIAGNIAFEAPNFDLFLLAVQTTASSLFPNFLFLDAPFNRNDLWNLTDPQRYIHEVASMGCRTRVYDNRHGQRTSIGRGNLSFTSINFPRLAIRACQKATKELPHATAQQLQAHSANIFIDQVKKLASIVAEQLHQRLTYQMTASAKQFPFMLQNNIWTGGNTLNPVEQVGDILKTGTLSIGFIGGHNAMMAIYGEGHGKNQQAYDTLTLAIQTLRDVADGYAQKYNLNYSVLATPAESLSGRFVKLDREQFGMIPGVTDRDYYVNSFHIDVKEQISSFAKIKKEAPFHALTNGGHITYVELDGEAQKNPLAILKIVKAMYDNSIGYGSINHPIDTCIICGFRGIIYHACPACASENISRMRRITGYLTGSLETWNAAKRAEEKDRVTHGLDD